MKLVIDEDAFGLKAATHTIAGLTKPPRVQQLTVSASCPTEPGGGIDTTYLPAGGERISSGTPTSNAGRWQFASDPEKIKAFRAWLRTQIQQTLTSQTEEELWRRYVEAGFRQGAGRAFDDVRQSKLRRERPELFTPEAQGSVRDFYRGTREEFLRSAFGRPESVDKVKLLAGRSFDDLEGITSDMSTRMSRALTDGLVRGEGPRDVARSLAREADLSSARAETIARTEIIRAHAEGQLEALDQLGVEEVGVMVEWSTAGDDAVCELCEEMEGVVLKIDEAHGMIPRHPRCRCSFVPANVGEDKEDQVRGKSGIESAIRGAGGEGNGWSSGAAISRDRPESILNIAYDPVAEFSRLMANWCNQYGGDTCKDGGSVTKDKKGPKKGKSALTGHKPKMVAKMGRRVGKASKEVQVKGGVALDGWKGKATTSQVESVRKFVHTSNSWSVGLNEALRGEGTANPEQSKVHRDMQRLFRDTPPLAKPITTYRGIALSSDKAEAFLGSIKKAQESGKPVEMRGYISTSQREKSAAGYASWMANPGDKQLVFQIKVRKGIGISGGLGDDAKTERYNAEVILNHKSRFRVLGVKGNRISLEQL